MKHYKDCYCSNFDKTLDNFVNIYIKEVEFAGDYEEPDYDWEESPIEGQHYSCCPICGIYIGEEHYEDCKLYNLIKHTEKMLNEL